MPTARRSQIEAKFVVADAAMFEKLLSLEALGEYRLVPRREEHAADPDPGTPPPDLFAREDAERTLRDVMRGARRVAVMSLDRVEVGRAVTQATHELEIQLTSFGRVSDLRALAKLLHPFGLRQRPLAKLERTLARVGAGDASSPRHPDGPGQGSSPAAGVSGAQAVAGAPERRGSRKRKRPGVLAADPMSEAGRRILRFHFEAMLANEAGTLAGEDPEALHDMRVATRRQRAALRFVGPHLRRKAIRPVRDGLRSLGGVLGAVRDLDVLLAAASAHRSTLPAEEARALQVLVDSWARRREAARAQMLVHLDGQAYAEFKEEYALFLDTPGAGARARAAGKVPHPTRVAHVVPAEIWAHYAAVCAFGTVLPWASVEMLHALRIEGKGLRYLLEFFREALDPCVEEAIEAVVKLQDHLGELQDGVVTVGHVLEFLVGCEAAASPEAATAAGRYLEARQARIEELRRGIDRSWAGVSGAAFKTCLARAVAAL